VLDGWAAPLGWAFSPRSPLLYACARYMCGVYIFGTMYRREWYSERIDRRLLLALRERGASMRNLCSKVGINERHGRGLVLSLVLAGFAYKWKGGKITIVNLTKEGKAYAEQLARELGENEVQRLLTPKPSKGKRAPRIKLDSKNLADSLGL